SAWRPGAVHSSRTLSRRHPSMKPLVLFVAACGVALAQPCADQSPMGAPGASPAWNGWGVDIQNTRFQPAKDAGLNADQVPGLKLKWAFGIPGAKSMIGQPTIASG